MPCPRGDKNCPAPQAWSERVLESISVAQEDQRPDQVKFQESYLSYSEIFFEHHMG